MNRTRFMLFGIDTRFYDKRSGRLLQFDGTFINQNKR